jgi:hypothetical protein
MGDLEERERSKPTGNAKHNVFRLVSIMLRILSRNNISGAGLAKVQLAE